MTPLMTNIEASIMALEESLVLASAKVRAAASSGFTGDVSDRVYDLARIIDQLNRLNNLK